MPSTYLYEFQVVIIPVCVYLSIYLVMPLDHLEFVSTLNILVILFWKLMNSFKTMAVLCAQYICVNINMESVLMTLNILTSVSTNLQSDKSPS